MNYLDPAAPVRRQDNRANDPGAVTFWPPEIEAAVIDGELEVEEGANLQAPVAPDAEIEAALHVDFVRAIMEES